MPQAAPERLPLDPFRLVLVSPMYGGNVGSCARVAANFELVDVRVVKSLCDTKGKDATRFAKGPAGRFLDEMQAHDELRTALEGCAAAVGFTRRTGALRQPGIELGELAGLASKGKVALVFGREDGGLTNDELQLCTHVCSFAVGIRMPSLNLSHAVAVVVSRLYESLARPRGEAEQGEELATIEELEELFTHWNAAIVDAGITGGGSPERMGTHIRRALQRARLSRQELGIFRAYLSKTQVALGTRSRGKRVANEEGSS